MNGIDKNMKYYIELFDDTFGNIIGKVEEYNSFDEAKIDVFNFGRQIIAEYEEDLRVIMQDAFDTVFCKNLCFSIYEIKRSRAKLSIEKLEKALDKEYHRNKNDFDGFIKQYCRKKPTFYLKGLPKNER